MELKSLQKASACVERELSVSAECELDALPKMADQAGADAGGRAPSREQIFTQAEAPLDAQSAAVSDAQVGLVHVCKAVMLLLNNC